MKKFLSTLCVVALALVCFLVLPTRANATSFGNCGNNVSWVLTDDGTLTISGTGSMQYYSTYNPAPWYSLRSSIKNVEVQEGVTNISSYAFYFCENLTSVTIADSVTSIGNYAFYCCQSLTDATIPDSTTFIGDYAFAHCAKLTSIVIPDRVTSIGDSTFFDCVSLRDVSIGKSVTTIGDQAFHYCDSLTSVVIPDSVTAIGISAFSSCSSLTSVVIGNSVTTIGSGAFNYCSSLASITIPDSVVSIDTDFYDCKKLTTLIIAEGSETVTDTMVICKSQLTKVFIPSSVNAVDATAFTGCSSLTGVYITDVAAWCNINFASYTSNPLHYSHELYLNGEQVIDLVIPDGVVSVGAYAFYDCDSLKSIAIPDSVTAVGDNAFAACSRLKYTTYDNAKYLGNASNPHLYLARCSSTSISSVAIHSDTKIIANSAFQDCVYLTTVTIPHNVTTISNYAFYNCTSLASVTVGDGVSVIGKQVFQGCNKLSSVTLGNSVTTIGKSAFYNCDNLTSINIPDSVISVGKQAFYDCDGLTYITLGSNVTTVGDYAFSGCGNLAAVITTDALTTIGNYAFYNCASLSSVTLGNNVTTVGDFAFYDCGSLNYTTYDNAKYLGNPSNPYLYLAKATSTSISAVAIHNDTRFVGEFAFYDCRDLISVTCGNNIIAIGNLAFENCNNLTSITTLDSVILIGERAFCNCHELTSVIISNCVTVIGDTAFYGCDSLSNVYYAGDQSQWNAITVGADNNAILNADIWYNHSAEHTFTNYVSNNDATCIKDGTETAQCDYCDETNTRTEEGSAKGHSYSKNVTKPTCKAKGYTTYTCACGDNYKSDYVKAKAHTYSKGKCTACGYKPAGVKITVQPKSVTVAGGKTAKVTVKATGSGLKYQWYYAKKGSSKYAKLSGKTSASYSAKMSASVDGRKVYCVITDQYGNTIKTKTVTLKGTPVKISTQPVNVAVKSGKTAKVTVKATGDGLKYQWYYAKKGSSKFTKLSGKTSASYSVKMSSSVNGRKVYCIITDQYGNTVKTATVTLYKGNAAKISTQPKSVAAVKNKTAKITVKATGDGLKYTWYYQKKGETKWTKTTVTKNAFSVTMAKKWNGCRVYCAVKDKYGITVKSNVVTLKMK